MLLTRTVEGPGREGYALTPTANRVRLAGGAVRGLPASPAIRIRVEAPGG